MRRFTYLLSLLFLLVCFAQAPEVRADTIVITVRSAAGPDPTAIQGAVDQFRADLGGVNNGNAVGSLPSGRREINWDEGGAAANATSFDEVMATFNTAPTTRGVVLVTDFGFRISGLPSPEFGEINATYPGIFQTFCAPRLFTPVGGNFTIVSFFVPGTTTPALTSGFGAVFTDVDLANTTTLRFFDFNNNSLGVFSVPTANNGLSFLGASFGSAIVQSVIITSGNVRLGRNDQNGNTIDVVAMDDFIYGEPQPTPEPTTMILLGTGLAGVGAAVRKRRKAE